MGSSGDYWEVSKIPRNTWVVPKCTWRDIIATTEALCSLESEGGETETFAPLHRAEGGFMCVSGPGFVSNEPAEGQWPRNPGQSYARKAIRFASAERGGTRRFWGWPSNNNSFAGARPDDVIFRGGEIINLRFEGQFCKRWTKKRCIELMEAVAKELKWEPKRGYNARLLRLARSNIQSDET